MWVLNDFDGVPVRYFDYPAEGTVEVIEVVEKLSFAEMLEKIGDCLF